MEYRSLSVLNIEVKSEGTDMYLEGYALTYNVLDSYNDIIKEGAASKSIAKEGKRVKFCYQHNFDKIAGKVVELREDSQGVFVRIKVGKGMWGREVRALIEDESIDELSIGFITIKASYDEENVRIIQELELREVSIVSRAANKEAKITNIELKSDLSNDELVELKRDTENLLQKINTEYYKRICKLWS